MGVNDEIPVALTDDERELLRCGLGEWGGPGRCTDHMAVAMGFESVRELLVQADRLRGALASKLPLTQRDWMRTLLATEVVFASDVLGSGADWATNTGFSDAETIRLLRMAQRKIPIAGDVEVFLRTDRPV